MAEPRPFRFLDLSAELRNIIYDLVLKDDHDGIQLWACRGQRQVGILPWHQGSPHNNVALLRVNHQIHDEASPVLYRDKFIGTNGQATHGFLKQIGPSVPLLRHVTIDYCNKSWLRSTLVLLKQATHLDRLELCYDVRRSIGDAERMVKEIGPWFRAFNKMRKADTTDNHDDVLSVLEFLARNETWVGQENRERDALFVAAYSAQVKDELRKTLKD